MGHLLFVILFGRYYIHPYLIGPEKARAHTNFLQVYGISAWCYSMPGIPRISSNTSVKQPAPRPDDPPQNSKFRYREPDLSEKYLLYDRIITKIKCKTCFEEFNLKWIYRFVLLDDHPVYKYVLVATPPPWHLLQMSSACDHPRRARTNPGPDSNEQHRLLHTRLVPCRQLHRLVM